MGTIWQPTLAEGQGPKYKLVALTIREGVTSGALAVWGTSCRLCAS